MFSLSSQQFGPKSDASSELRPRRAYVLCLHTEHTPFCFRSPDVSVLATSHHFHPPPPPTFSHRPFLLSSCPLLGGPRGVLLTHPFAAYTSTGHRSRGIISLCAPYRTIRARVHVTLPRMIAGSRAIVLC